MQKRILVSLAFILVCWSATLSQQAQPQLQPLTFFYEYTVNPGQEEEFWSLVKTVGQPVRDKFLADGVVHAWGIEVPLLRSPGGPTHLIWFTVSDWAGVEKVLNGMAAQLAKLAAEEAKAADAARKNRQKPAMTTAERTRAVFDASKTRDWLTRDLVIGLTSAEPPAGLLPYTRYGWVKVRPGKGGEYRKAWEKYNKPVLDKLLSDGVILAYGLAVEEVKTDGNFTHFTWAATPNLAAADKATAAFAADRARRSQDERDDISALFASLTDPDAARSAVTRAVVFRVK